MTQKKTKQFFQNNKSKIALSIILLLTVCMMLFSCTIGKSVSTKISAGDTVLANETIKINSSVKTALDAFQKAANQQNLTFTADNGMVTQIGKFKGTETEGWCFYVNGKVSDTGAQAYTVKDGDKISFEYVNWAKIYPKK